jgi:hypothetical protein
MRLGFHKAALLFFGMAFSGLAACLTAQQAPSSARSVTPAAADAVPDAPTPQIELSSAAGPQSGQTQSAQQPSAAGRNPNNGAGQSAPARAAHTGAISGTATDAQDEVVPDASVELEGPSPADHRQVVANDDGGFEFEGLKPGIAYHVTIKAKGFATWDSPAIVLSPGEYKILTDVKLVLQGEQTSVKVYASSVELATEQVKIEEQQRIFGVIPNFYVVYDPANAAPLTAKLKFKLAMKVSIDPVTMAGVLFFAGIDQAARLPDYREGAAGYGERVGAVGADGFADILIGGAILPSLLHQDPRYYYQGTGTIKSRVLHAISNPFICKGDNGRLQPNFSTIGGDVATAALSNLYYPSSDRTGAMLLQNVWISTLERTAASLAQEFLLRKLTPKAKANKAEVLQGSP